MKIQTITAREILDSRGNPTISATVELQDGIIGEASVPSGASTGSRESLELRDHDPKRYFGEGELTAVKNVCEVIAPALEGRVVENQGEIDQVMIDLDGTPKKTKLGANAILAVSLAVARAAALTKEKELYEYLGELYGNKKFSLPTPMFNLLNGGKHSENKVDIQEVMVVPVGLKSFELKLQAGDEIYHSLKGNLMKAGMEVGLGDEGGFAPELAQNTDTFDQITKAIKAAGYSLEKVRVSADFASTEFFDPIKKKYVLSDEGKEYDSKEFIQLISRWVKKYHLLSVEDGLAENDPDWANLTKKIKPAFTVGDDLFTTDPERIELGVKEGLAGGVIIKPNQIGTLTETLEAIRAAQKGKIKVIISHRSGETEDSFIADLAVGVGADFIKAGAPARSERLAKYNRLSKIEEELKR
jgi:enolase